MSDFFERDEDPEDVFAALEGNGKGVTAPGAEVVRPEGDDYDYDEGSADSRLVGVVFATALILGAWVWLMTL